MITTLPPTPAAIFFKWPPSKVLQYFFLKNKEFILIKKKKNPDFYLTFQ